MAEFYLRYSVLWKIDELMIQLTCHRTSAKRPPSNLNKNSGDLIDFNTEKNSAFRGEQGEAPQRAKPAADNLVNRDLFLKRSLLHQLSNM